MCGGEKCYTRLYCMQIMWVETKYKLFYIHILCKRYMTTWAKSQYSNLKQGLPRLNLGSILRWRRSWDLVQSMAISIEAIGPGFVLFNCTWNDEALSCNKVPRFIWSKSHTRLMDDFTEYLDQILISKEKNKYKFNNSESVMIIINTVYVIVIVWSVFLSFFFFERYFGVST